MSDKEQNKNKEVPSWKSDFPVNQEEATYISRREFAKYLCLFSGALALGNGAIAAKSYLSPKKENKEEYFVCETSEVPIGEMKEFQINNKEKKPYILIHLAEDTWRAFEQKCTHLSCSVRYRGDLKKIECPCHQGYFDANTGNVLQGPPPRPLPQLNVIIRDNKIFVSKLS